MKNQFNWLIISLLILPSCQDSSQSEQNKTNHYSWENSHDRTWAGEYFWANRLQDWEVKNGRLECKIPNPMRTVHLLKNRLGTEKKGFEISVETGLIEHSDSLSGNSATGILLGAGKDLDYRAASLIHHSYGKFGGIFVGVNLDGVIFVRNFENESYFDRKKALFDFDFSKFKLNIRAIPDLEKRFLKLEVEVLNFNDEKIGGLTILRVPEDRLIGNIALVSHGEKNEKSGRFWFNNFKLSGEKIKTFEERSCGPILSCQHTLSDGVLKLTAQFMPIGKKDTSYVLFQTKKDGKWRDRESAHIVKPGYTATFKIGMWDDTQDIPYRILYESKNKLNTLESFDYEGVIKKNPIKKNQISVGAFTGNHNNVRPNPAKWGGVDVGKFPWDWGLWFPHSDIVESVKKHDPDVLFFSGDQVYEGASPTWADRQNAETDYLYKWYLWCWAFGELTVNIPTITIPDDHDVYHGNIWGAGGIATPEGLHGAAAQDMGGFKMSPEFVNMVQRTQTSHFPDPFDATPAAQNIGVYYTDMNYGGISFAILEDRKFKSAPKTLLPEAKIRNGWAANQNWEAKTQSDHSEAKLLGERQLKFLENWAVDWSGGSEMKAVLSQTIFANVATLPEEAQNDGVVPKLPILKKGDYPPNDRPVADMDSNGWPATGRNNALRAMRKGFAVHIAGDQHLGSTIQYGVENFGDAGFALCVPSIGNFWPRRWFPIDCGENRQENSPCYTGNFEDGFGNKISVHAISNPLHSNLKPIELHSKANGYGIVKFDKNSRQVTMENWPRWANPDSDKPYFGWPVKFNQEDNFGKDVFGYLAKVKINSGEKLVLRVAKSETKEVVYCLRKGTSEFSVPVFEDGIYDFWVEEHEPGNKKKTVYFASEIKPEPTETHILKVELNPSEKE